jgi:hypothetical protein
MVPLVALVAELAVAKFAPAGPAAPAPGARDFRHAWGALVAYGLAGGLLLSFPNVLGRLPLAGAFFQRTVLKRIQGHRAEAAELRRAVDSAVTPDGRPPHIVAHHYQKASLFAFYLPGHPPVSAGGYAGHRRSSFDEWPDTRLDNPALFGRCLLLEGKGDTRWDGALLFDRLDTVVEDKFYLAVNYRGPRPARAQSDDAGE